MSLPIDVPPAEAPTPPAQAALPVPQSAGGTPGPAPSGHPAGHEPAPGPGAEQPTSGQRSSIGHELDRLGVDDPEERLGFLSLIAGRPVDTLADLTRPEAGQAVTVLKAAGTRADLGKLSDG